MSDQIQVASVVSSLSTLLSLPEVQEGMRDGIEAFRDRLFYEDHSIAWDEKQVARFVSRELSNRIYQRGCRLDQAMGWPSLSYFHQIGFALGYLDQALAANAEQCAQEHD